MIISHRHKFIFIKTKKTAGTAVECWLNSSLGEDDVATPIVPRVDGHVARNYKGFVGIGKGFNCFRMDSTQIKRLLRRQRYWNHMKALEVKKRIGEEIWDSYFKFCVERNPWDKAVSLYFMIKKRDEPDLTFEDFLRSPALNNARNFGRYTDGNGSLIVDKVVRYENLSEELDSLEERLGGAAPFSSQEKVKAGYGRNGADHREIFGEQSVDLIRDRFSDEIAEWGYSF